MGHASPRLTRRARRQTPTVDVEYQARRHLEVQLKQWPKLDPVATLERIRAAVARGDAWLWPQPAAPEHPVQLELFA